MFYSRCSRDFEHGDLDVAVREAQEGLQRSEKYDLVWNYKFRILLANIYLWKGGKAKEVTTLLEADPPPQLSSGEFAARRKVLQGALFTRQQKLKDAHACLQQAGVLAVKDATTVQSEILLNEGTLAVYETNFVAAERYLLAALNAARAHHQPFVEAQITGSLGWMQGQQDHYRVAIDWLNESLAVAQSIGARQIEAATLANLGWMNSEIGDFESAVSAFKEVENLTENSSLKEIRQNNLGEVYRNQEKYTEAWNAFSKARELARSSPGYTDGFVDSLSGLAWVALAQGQISTAEPLEQEAQKVLSESKSPNPALAVNLQLLHAELLRASGHPNQAQELLFSLLKQTILPSDRWQADFELATVYVDTHQNGLAQRQFEKVLGTLDSARGSLSDLNQELAFSTRESSFYKSYVEFLVSTGKQFDAFRIAGRIRARTLREQPNKPSAEQGAPLPLSALQAALGSRKQVLLSYWLAPKRSFVWLVTASRFQMFELPSSGSLEPKLETYLDEMVKGKGIQDAAGRDGEELYKILITPVEKFIPENADIVIVPDETLATLNFETLVVPGSSPHYWINDVTVSNAVSVATLTRHSPSSHPTEELLAIGDPIDKSGSPALAHAKEEIRLVSSYEPTRREVVITGKDATPSAYAASHPERFRRIHFAAHGVSNQIRPLESAILLSPDGENSNSLYGYDILKHKLNAELVVISSCKGAEGRIYGEGSVGLAWAFMKAGAHQVIAALWNLDDASAAELMKTFYDGLSAGQTPAAALRAAKLSLMKDSNHQRPYYWATLQVYLGS